MKKREKLSKLKLTRERLRTIHAGLPATDFPIFTPQNSCNCGGQSSACSV